MRSSQGSAGRPEEGYESWPPSSRPCTHAREGRKEVLDFRLARSEGRAEWERFLTDLQVRGLTGEGLTVIVADGGAGLHAVLPTVYPQVRMQRCWAHNPQRARQRVACPPRRVTRDLHRISHAADRITARRATRRSARNPHVAFQGPGVRVHLLPVVRDSRGSPCRHDRWPSRSRIRPAVEHAGQSDQLRKACSICPSAETCSPTSASR